MVPCDLFIFLCPCKACRRATEQSPSFCFPFPVPRFSFEKESYEVEEGMNSLEIMVKREGPDLSQKAQVVVMSQLAAETAAKGQGNIEKGALSVDNTGK